MMGRILLICRDGLVLDYTVQGGSSTTFMWWDIYSEITSFFCL